MNEQGYINKVKNTFEQPTYRPIPSNPTNKYEGKLISN